MPNDDTGRIAGGPDLAGPALDFIANGLGQTGVRWDRAQVSVCYPGYPLQGEESDAAFRFRRDRYAAHVDGLLPISPQRRRHLQEFHRFILGLPLSQAPAEAAPFVVWEGSHRIMGAMFKDLFAGLSPEAWPDVDVTQAYQATRRDVFETCKPVLLPARPGEAYLVHRHALHGVAPWDKNVVGPEEGRVIAYFRPEFIRVSDWL